MTNSTRHLEYTVLPSLPPSIAFTSVPPAVNRGTTLDLAVDATDNRAIHRVEFTLAGKTFTASAPEADGRTFKLQIPGAEIPAGTHTLIARAVDRVGNFASTTATVTATLADRDGDGVARERRLQRPQPGRSGPARSTSPTTASTRTATAPMRSRAWTRRSPNSWVASTRTTKVTILKVRGAPAARGSSCAAPSAAARSRSAASRPRAGRWTCASSTSAARELRVGATLEIRVLVPGHIAKVARFTMRKRKAPLTAYLCLARAQRNRHALAHSLRGVRQLSSLDAQFLNVESARIYGHVAFLGIYDPSTAPGGVLGGPRSSAAGARGCTCFRRCAGGSCQVPLGLDLPYWVEDPDFDLEFHVRETALPAPGDDRQLAETVQRVFARPLDRGRPLWEIYVIHGLEGGRVALLTKIHHSVVDGLSGNEIMGMVLDPEPDGRASTPRRRSRRSPSAIPRRPRDAGARPARAPAPAAARAALAPRAPCRASPTCRARRAARRADALARVLARARGRSAPTSPRTSSR